MFVFISSDVCLVSRDMLLGSWSEWEWLLYDGQFGLFTRISDDNHLVKSTKLGRRKSGVDSRIRKVLFLFLKGGFKFDSFHYWFVAPFPRSKKSSERRRSDLLNWVCKMGKWERTHFRIFEPRSESEGENWRFKFHSNLPAFLHGAGANSILVIPHPRSRDQKNLFESSSPMYT